MNREKRLLMGVLSLRNNTVNAIFNHALSHMDLSRKR